MWKTVLTSAKPSYRAKRDPKGILLPTIANYGIKKGQTAIRAHGKDYIGFSIQALDDIKPLLTNERVSRGIKFLAHNDIQSTINVLQLRKPVQKYGIDIIYYTLKIWLEKNQIQVPTEYLLKADKIKDKVKDKDIDNELVSWITRRRSEPLFGKIKIMAVGKSTIGTVVPVSWLGREFSNARILHQKMNKLEWRKGRPPVYYCCIYSMSVINSNKWKPVKEFNHTSNNLIGLSLQPDLEKELLNCQIKFFNTSKRVDNTPKRWIHQFPKNYVYNILQKNKYKLLIVCDLQHISRKSSVYQKTDNIGILVSRLQKAIRRGSHCPNILKDAIEKLSIAPAYNLPEQQFVRVSGSRQLAWRLYITIIEDASPYKPQRHYFSLLDILSLALIAQLDSNIQFSEWIINKLILTALLVQCVDKKRSNWSWRKGQAIKKLWTNSNSGSMSLALKFMPMMSNDFSMLQKGLGHLPKMKLHELPNIHLNNLLKSSQESIETKCRLAAIDMHCMPNILILLQGTLSFLPYNKDMHTTKKLSSFIWTFSSRINVRYDYKENKNEEIRHMLNSLKQIQENSTTVSKYAVFPKFPKFPKNKMAILKSDVKINYSIRRLSFLLIFGETIYLPKIKSQKAVEIIVAGTKEEPCKVKRNKKYLDSDLSTDKKEINLATTRYFELMLKGKKVQLANPPHGYRWIDVLTKKSKVIIKTDKKRNFYVNNIKLESFDASSLLVKMDYPVTTLLNNELKALIRHCLYNKSKTKLSEWELLQTLLHLSKERLNKKHFVVYDWLNSIKNNSIPSNIWKAILVRLYDTVNGSVYIGPVDRRGNKLHVAINYMYEGTMMRILLMLSMLYPRILKSASMFRFNLNTNYEEYQHMIDCLEKLAFRMGSIKENIGKIIIKTKLWDHQQRTSDDMTRGFTIIGKKGFGDASNVGAGKTLTALQVMINLLKYNKEKKHFNHKGFLVLMPALQLYKTWIEEIQKHTKGFYILIQNANGSINDLDGNFDNVITFNTILITSLGRIRNHPISNSWILVTIDECLSVQNRDALQTQEAWRQIVCSQYGVIMMSATFFKSRFDKLFYMLKMLRSGLPERKEYLDTILSEHIFCHIPKTMRKWITSTNRYELNAKQRKEYEELQKLDIGSDKLYVILSKYVYDHFNFIECFRKTLDGLDINKKALIYAQSKVEADKLATTYNDISRYPNKTGKHCAVSYAEGTYGLNDLTDYNTIVIRLEGDISQIHQMKGRLDREGQVDDTLYLEYILLSDTIYEANMIKLNIGNSFYKNHILPLALFYDIAVGKN